MRYFIFRNFTIEPLFSKFDAEFSGYDDISEYPESADIFVWFYQIPFNPDASQKIALINHFLQKIDLLIKKLPTTKDFLIFTLWDFLEVKWQNSDFDLCLMISEFNNKIISWSKIHNNLKIIDFNDFIRDARNENIISWKYYYTSLASINPALSEKFQNWFRKKCDAIAFKRKKCLIIDLDNTLWGGILGEDGLEGIKLGNDYPGICFTDFQHLLAEASRNGIILAICSKNNENEVLELFERNPGMVLKMDNMVSWRINWNNKPTNIKELAAEMNIGLDSMVFIDDSPVERDLVRNTLPEVTVPEFPIEPYKIIPFFLTVLDDYFQIYKLNEEDLNKTIQYKENFSREKFKSYFTSIEEYLQNLEIELEIKNADKFTIPRIAQMTQKTNQFNLTTKRYLETDILKFVKTGDLVLCAAAKDKFGDNGITLLSIVTFNIRLRIADIDTFLLSCRILGRGIENVFLKFVLNQIFLKGFHKVHSYYYPTSKNGIAKSFYEQNGFHVIENSAKGSKYELELNNIIELNPYYKIRYIE